jgi:hypothetical protein
LDIFSFDHLLNLPNVAKLDAVGADCSALGWIVFIKGIVLVVGPGMKQIQLQKDLSSVEC